MPTGDGIRRNIFSISASERKRFVDAIVQLNLRKFPGTRTDFPAGGVSFWFKMDEIHQATHVHNIPSFLPWHRELCNYFESLLREVDPVLSLHYWDWNQSIAPLFPLFGNTRGEMGEPWLSAKFYDPAAPDDKWRDEIRHSNPFTPTWKGRYDEHSNPADPPKTRPRNVQTGIPPVGMANWPSDSTFINATTFSNFDSLMQGMVGNAHAAAHGWLGLGDPHTSFRDPLVFLMHSNVDRLWAMWQTHAGHTDRLDPNQVYGGLGSDPDINELLHPWAGTSPWPTRPWYRPENQQYTKTSKHPTVVRPPHYDTLPMYPLPRSLACDQIIQFSGTSSSTGSQGAYVDVYNSLSTFTSTGGFVELRFGDFTFDHSSGPTRMALDVRFVLDGKPQVATRFERGSQCQLFARVPSGFAGTHILNLEVRSVLVAGPPIDCHISGTATLIGASLSSFEETKLMAYLNWCGRGFPAQDDWVDWFRAEKLRQERVREAAYFHWLNRGRPVGDDWTDWFWAEQL